MDDRYRAVLDFINECHVSGIYDEDTLHTYIKLALGFNVPKRANCEHHTAPFSFVADVFFERTSSAIVFANRTGGKTRLSSVINWLSMVFKPGCEITHAGSVIKQANLAYKYLQEYVNKPWYKDMVKGKPIQSMTELKNGSSISIITASYDGFNGPHPNLCLTGDAQVLTTSGYIPIDKLPEGPVMLKAYNTYKREFVNRYAVKFPAGHKKPVALLLEDGTLLDSFSEFHKILVKNGSGLERVNAAECMGKYVLCSDGTFMRVKKVTMADYSVPMYDMSITSLDLAERYFVADGIVVANSNVDEVELIPWDLLQEAFSMSMTKNGIKGIDILYSTRKKMGGTMDRLLREAGNMGFKVYNWCIFDVVQKCDLPYHCTKSCPAGKNCVEEGKPEGTARTGAGYYPISDFVKKVSVLDKSTFQAQWACKKPTSEGLYYREFDRATHVVDVKQFCEIYGLPYNEGLAPKDVIPKDWPRMGGFDWGSTHPTVFIDFAWDKINDRLFAVREYYVANRAPSDHARAWVGQIADRDIGPGHYKRSNLVEDFSDVRYWFLNADPSGKSYLLEFAKPEIVPTWDTLGETRGIRIGKAINDKSFGYTAVKERMSISGSLPRLVFFSDCEHAIDEHERLHHPNVREGRMPSEYPEEVDDHATDVTRYVVARLKLAQTRSQRRQHSSGRGVTIYG